MSSVKPKQEFWLIVGSQKLYGEETLNKVLEQSSEVAGKINKSSHVSGHVRLLPIMTTEEEIRSTLMKASADSSCLGVLLWMHTFSPAKMWATALKNFHKPLLHLHTQANRSLPWGEIDMDFMNLNQAAHGDREHGHIQARLGKRRSIVVGHVEDKETLEKIDIWMRSSVGWHTSQNLRMVRFGDNMRNVAVTEGDKVSAQIDLGLTIETHSINSLVEIVESISEETISALVEIYNQEYEMDERLLVNNSHHQSLRDAAAIELGIRKVLVDGNYQAFTTNFEDLGNLKQLPGISVQRLMAEGYGFGGEGDWKTSALLRIINSMSAGLSGGSSFMEDYTYHFAPGVPKVLGAHMLEVSPSIFSGKPRCEIHPLSIGGKSDPVRLVFNADSSKARVTGLMDMGDRFRLLTNSIEVVQPDSSLTNLPVASAVWIPEPNLSTSAECWIYSGGSHHTVFSNNLDIRVLREFSNIAGIELLEIDEATEFHQFKKEMRLNSLFYSLKRFDT
jgi:L-arabinose isomerase